MQTIKRSSSQASVKGPAGYFTGNVRIEPLFSATEPGATATTAMSHIAIQEHLDGKVVEWMEKVADEEYMAEVQ